MYVLRPRFNRLNSAYVGYNDRMEIKGEMSGILPMKERTTVAPLHQAV